jgi:hypothetical protein
MALNSSTNAATIDWPASLKCSALIPNSSPDFLDLAVPKQLVEFNSDYQKDVSQHIDLIRESINNMDSDFIPASEAFWFIHSVWKTSSNKFINTIGTFSFKYLTVELFTFTCYVLSLLWSNESFNQKASEAKVEL